MKKILLLAGLVIFSACDDLELNDNNIDTSQHVNVLVGVTNGTVPASYQYDENQRLSGIVQQGGNGNGSVYNAYTAALTYNANGKLAQIYYDYPGSAENMVTRYTYNDDGTILQVLHSGIDDATSEETLLDKVDYTYAENAVTAIKEFVPTGDLNKTIYTSQDGNVVKVEHFLIDASHPDGQLTTTENYSDFDDKKIATESLPAEYRFPMIFKNNYTKVSVGADSNAYEYTYNPDGYPVKRTQSGIFNTTFDFVRL